MVTAAMALVAGIAGAATEPSRLTITLAAAEASATAHSPTLRAAEDEADAAAHRSAAAFAPLLPRLSVDGAWRYQTEVPEFSVVPGKPPLQFGTHDSWSVGPQASWTVWDSGATFNQWRAAAAAARAKRAEADAQRAALRLRVRSAYFGTLLALEQVRLLGRSLIVAQQQAADIETRYQAGASSRVDELQAQNDRLSRTALFRQARADLAGSLRDLFALTGLGGDADPALPLDEATSATRPADAAAPSFVVSLEPVDRLLSALAPAADAPFNPEPARVRAVAAAAAAAGRQAAAVSAARWPAIRLTARATEDYPNGPVPERVQQNTLSVAATMPLFAFGQVHHQAADARAQARAGDERAEQAREDAARDWRKAQDAVASLKDQRVLLAKAAAQAQEIARLVFISYTNGGASFLEVESANLGALSAGVQAARADVQLLIELAIAGSLTE